MSYQFAYDFDQDYEKLKIVPHNIFSLSSSLSSEVIKGGLTRYRELYSYFWQLIDQNKSYCKNCETTSCHNRYFLIQLKKSQFTENDLYILTYMTTYFLDLIINKGVNLSEAYYILSRGHNYVLSFILGKKSIPFYMKGKLIENYQGYLLAVLYYLLPNFKYILRIKTNENN